MSDLRVGQAVRVWYGPGFIREGQILAIDLMNCEVYVKFAYPGIDNAWVGVHKLC